MTDTSHHTSRSLGRIRHAALAAILTFLLSFAGILVLTYAVYHRPSLDQIEYILHFDLKAQPLEPHRRLYQETLETHLPQIHLISVRFRSRTLVVTARMHAIDAERYSQRMRQLIEKQRNDIIQTYEAGLADEERLLNDYETAIAILAQQPDSTFSSGRLLDALSLYVRNRRGFITAYKAFDSSLSRVELSYRTEKQISGSLGTLIALVFTGFLYCLFMSLLVFRIILFRFSAPPEMRTA